MEHLIKTRLLSGSGSLRTEKEVREMKAVVALALILAVTFFGTSFSMAAGWDSCKGCHKDGDKPGPSTATLLKKFKTAEALIKAAKESKNPMMNNFKKDDQLKAAAKDLGLK